MAKRIDGNQQDIVKKLRKIGYSVCILSSMGKGVPDLLIGRAGKNYLIELKDGAKYESQQRLTPDEQKWHDAWRGQVAVCNCLSDILILK